MVPQTLLTPFQHPSSTPALVLPASAPTPNLSLSYTQLSSLIHDVRFSLDTWDGAGKPLQAGDVVSLSLVNGVEFAVGFLGVGAHR